MSSRAINYTGGAIKSITGAYDAKYSPLVLVGILIGFNWTMDYMGLYGGLV